MIFLAVEAVRVFVAHRLLSTVATLLSAGFLLAIGSILYLSALEAKEANLTLDVGIARVIEVRALDSTFSVSSEMVQQIRLLHGVRGTLGIGEVVDVEVPGLAGVHPAAGVSGDLEVTQLPICTWGSPMMFADASQFPRIGRVAIGSDGAEFPIARRVGLDDWFASVGLSLVSPCIPTEASGLSRLLVYVNTVGDITPVSDALRALLADRSDELTVRSAEDLVAFRDSLETQLEVQRKQRLRTTLVAFAAVLLLFRTAITAMRRADIGRQRALGASRSSMAIANLAQALTGVLAGATLNGVVSVSLVLSGVPEWGLAWQIPGVCLLVLATTLALVPTLVIAGWSDPAKALRVP